MSGRWRRGWLRISSILGMVRSSRTACGRPRRSNRYTNVWDTTIESEIYSLIMSKKEIKQMGELTCSQPNISWDRLTFSAKESVYKAWFPTYGKWLDFTDCEVMFYLDSHRPNNQPKELVVGRYHAQLLKSKRSYSCNGQWAFVPFFNLLITTTAGSLTES